MQIWQALILGMVQGITEFLPISSSGHLILFEQLLNVNCASSELFLGIMLHAGTLVAVCFLYYKKIIALLKNKKGILFLLVATVPAALVGFFLSNYIEKVMQGRLALAFAFLCTAILLLIADKLQKKRKDALLEEVNLKSSIYMGLGQALAVLPGVSRSGATYAVGIYSGLSKRAALDFSFIMSIPIILGAIVNEILKICMGKATAAMQIPMTTLCIGMATAMVFGILSIKLYQKLVVNGKFKYFIFYLFILSAILFFFPIV